jgi:hypothetical protein
VAPFSRRGPGVRLAAISHRSSLVADPAFLYVANALVSLLFGTAVIAGGIVL